MKDFLGIMLYDVMRDWVKDDDRTNAGNNSESSYSNSISTMDPSEFFDKFREVNFMDQDISTSRTTVKPIPENNSKKHNPIKGEAKIWSIFGQILHWRDRDQAHTKSQNYENRSKTRRFLDRVKDHMQDKSNGYSENDADVLALLLGHYSLLGGNFVTAIVEYDKLRRKDPENFLNWAFMGFAYTNLVSQRFTTKRNSAMVQALGFFERYRQLREKNGCKQEVLYNMGRAWHQVGFKDFAIQYYRLALNCPPPDIFLHNQDLVGVEEENTYDLTPEIAYNMSLIYRNSGNEQLANAVLAQYCSV